MGPSEASQLLSAQQGRKIEIAGILIPAGSDLRTSSLWTIMLRWLAEAHRLGVQCGVPFQDTVSFPQYQDLEPGHTTSIPFPVLEPAWYNHPQ